MTFMEEIELMYNSAVLDFVYNTQEMSNQEFIESKTKFFFLLKKAMFELANINEDNRQEMINKSNELFSLDDEYINNEPEKPADKIESKQENIVFVRFNS